MTEVTDSPGEVLRDHNLFRTTSLEEARDQVARVFCPHRLETTSGSGTVNTVHNRISLGTLSINYLDYGAEVAIRPGALNSFFLVQMPLSGGSEVTCGKATVTSTPHLASVPSPTDDLSMVWHDDSPHLLVYVSRTTAEARLRELLGHELIAPLRFNLGMDLTTPEAISWRRLLDLAVSDGEAGGLILQTVVRDQLEDVILTGLLMTHQHNYSEPLARNYRPVAPRVIRDAVALFDANPERTPTMTELARAAGVSIRSLQVGFQQYMGMSPTEYLRDVRLQRVHEELLSTESENRSVAEIAYRWGFNHLGRFAQMYRKRFGELPSRTHRR